MDRLIWGRREKKTTEDVDDNRHTMQYIHSGANTTWSKTELDGRMES